MAEYVPISVLIPIHDSFDILDVFGPLEILLHARSPTDTSRRAFQVTITAEERVTHSDQDIAITRDIDIQHAYNHLDTFDILIVPGGGSEKLLRQNKSQPMELIKRFGMSTSFRERIMMSVCTGSLFLAKAGALRGQTVTTNSSFLDRLRDQAEAGRYAVPEKGARFIVNPAHGANSEGSKGYRVVTSAGPGAGFDLSYWVLEHYLGKTERQRVENLVEIKNRLSEGIILG